MNATVRNLGLPGVCFEITSFTVNNDSILGAPPKILDSLLEIIGSIFNQIEPKNKEMRAKNKKGTAHSSYL
jgi:hypothetical protein